MNIKFFNKFDNDTITKLIDLAKNNTVSYKNNLLTIQNSQNKLTITKKVGPFEFTDLYDLYPIFNNGYTTTTIFLKNHHEIKKVDDIVYDIIGNPVAFENNLYQIKLVFTLNDKVILIRNYNQDLDYFFMEVTKLNNHSLKLFFQKDYLQFQTENYLFAQFLKIDETTFKQFFNVGDFSENNDLSEFYYFKNIAFKHLTNLVKPNLTILAKNGLNYTLDYEANDDYDSVAIIIQDKNNQILIKTFLNYTFKTLEFNDKKLVFYNFNELDKQIINIANELNKYLQTNIFVAYSKIITLLNVCKNNVSHNKITNSNHLYLCNSLQVAHGQFRMEFNENYTLDDYILIWKYDNNTLFFNVLKLYDLCVEWTKHQSLNNINLIYKLTNAKNYHKITYYLTQMGIDFKLWTSYANINRLNNQFCVDLLPNYDETKIMARFIIDYYINNDFNNIFNNLYHQFENEIIKK